MQQVGCSLSHSAVGHVNGCKRWRYGGGEVDVVEPNDRDIFRDASADRAKASHCPDGQDIIPTHDGGWPRVQRKKLSAAAAPALSE